MECANCRGRGIAPGTTPSMGVACPGCDGTGVVKVKSVEATVPSKEIRIGSGLTPIVKKGE